MAFRSTTTLASGTRSNSAITVPSGVTSGDIVVISFYIESNTAITAPSGFTLKYDSTFIYGYRNLVYWKRATGADSGTYTFSHSSAYCAAECSVFSGRVTTGDPFESYGITGGYTSAITRGVTATSGADLFGTDTQFTSPSTRTVPSGMTRSDSGTDEIAAYYQEAVSAGSVDKTFTGTASGSSITSSYNTFEGGTDGANITVSTSGGLSGNAFSFLIVNNASAPSGDNAIKWSSSSAKVGSMGMLYTPRADSSTFVRQDFTASSTRSGIGMWVRFGSIGSTGNTLFMAIRGSSSSIGGVTFYSSNHTQIQVVNASNAAITASRTSINFMSANAWYFIQLWVTPGTNTSNGRFEFLVHDTGGNLIHSYDSGATQNAGTVGVAQMRWLTGISNAEYAPIDADSLMAETNKSSGYFDPNSAGVYRAFLGALRSGGSTGQIKIMTSGSMATKPIKVYNGSPWAIKPLKRYNGTSWTTTPY